MDIAPSWVKPKQFTEPYPPYHKGKNLEDYFQEFYTTAPKKPKIFRYLGISWNTIYNTINGKEELQKRYLDSLKDNEGRFFTVCQGDECPAHNTLPKNTAIFSASGFVRDSRIIPIPLVCSKLGDIPQKIEKEYLCSYIGSNTHPVRQHVVYTLKNKQDVFLYERPCEGNFIQQEIRNFAYNTAKSKFCIAPRGSVPASYRLYEAMQLKSIPVYISDIFYLPYKNQLDWSKLAVLIEPKDVENMYDILKGISKEKQEEMLRYTAEVYDKYFSMEGVCNQIFETITSFDASIK